MDSKAVDLVPVLPACLKYHGWPVRTVAQVQFQQTLAAIREIDSGDYHLEHCRGSTHDLFIDGSCPYLVTRRAGLQLLQLLLLSPGFQHWNTRYWLLVTSRG